MTRLEYLQTLDSTVRVLYDIDRDAYYLKGEHLGQFRPGSSDTEAVDNTIAEMLICVRMSGGYLKLNHEGVEHEVTADKLRGLNVETGV